MYTGLTWFRRNLGSIWKTAEICRVANRHIPCLRRPPTESRMIVVRKNIIRGSRGGKGGHVDVLATLPGISILFRHHRLQAANKRLLNVFTPGHKHPTFRCINTLSWVQIEVPPACGLSTLLVDFFDKKLRWHTAVT